MNAPVSSTSQIALPLEPGEGAHPDRIVIGNANAAAIEALQEPHRWPFHAAVLTGPPRSGKSLLGRWIASQGIEVIDAADARDETDLFHRWNASQEGGSRAGEPFLMIADALPWQVTLPDLRSRLGGSLQLELSEPDDAMAAQLIESFAAQRNLSLGHGAADYLVPRATRSFAALERLVLMIDRISLERQTPATMSVWRAALEALHGPEQQNLL
ncbi:MAG: ATPase [Pseudomonadota bacterium]|nr:ATPase [Pseudomonadota bacterium]